MQRRLWSFGGKGNYVTRRELFESNDLTFVVKFFLDLYIMVEEALISLLNIAPSNSEGVIDQSQ